MENRFAMKEALSAEDMAGAENIKRSKARPAKKPPKKITQKYLYNTGLAYLQRFPASVSHFRRTMGRKIAKSCAYHKDQDPAVCEKLLDEAVATFERQGLLNDAAYLQGMVNSLRRRGLSGQAILSKLQQKGLSSEAVKEVLSAQEADHGGQDADFTAALRLMRRKRLGCFRKGEPQPQKDMGACARAGFSFDIAHKALALSLDEAETYLAQQI
jgi:regulatory protein